MVPPVGDDGDAGEAHVAATGVAAGSQCGAAAGGVNRATRSISRRIRSPSTGPSAYSGIGRSQTADPRDTASAPAQKYSRQSSKSRMPPFAMIGRRKPASRSSATTRRPMGLIARPLDRPVAVLEVGLAGVGTEAQALDGVDRGDRRAAVGRGQVRLPVVVLVRADLEDHRVAAPGDSAAERLLEDGPEREVDVVAGGVELDRRDLTRLRPLVHGLDQLFDLIGREAAHGHDPVQVRRPAEVLVEVALDADVRPAEGVEPAAVDLVQRPPVEPQHFRELAQAPVLLEREVALARLERDGAGRHGAEALQRHPLGDG